MWAEREEGRVAGLRVQGSHLHSGASHYHGVYSLSLAEAFTFWFDVPYGS